MTDSKPAPELIEVAMGIHSDSAECDRYNQGTRCPTCEDFAKALHSHAAEAVKKRDQRYHEILCCYYEDPRSLEDLAGTFTDVADGIMHETIKRDPRVIEAVKAEAQAWLDAIGMPYLSNHRVKAVGEAIQLAVKTATEELEATVKVYRESNNRHIDYLHDMSIKLDGEREARERVEKGLQVLSVQHGCKHADDHGIAPMEYQRAVEGMLEWSDRAKKAAAEVERQAAEIVRQAVSHAEGVDRESALRKRVEELEAERDEVAAGVRTGAVDVAALMEQARREGAEEALDRAAECAESYVKHGGDAALCDEIGQEIRALDPPKAQEPDYQGLVRCAAWLGLSIGQCGNPMPCSTHYPDPPKNADEVLTYHDFLHTMACIAGHAKRNHVCICELEEKPKEAVRHSFERGCPCGCGASKPEHCWYESEWESE